MINSRMLLSLTRLANGLKKMGFHKDSGDIVSLLNDLLDANSEQDTRDEDRNPVDSVVSIMGLREDGTFDNMNQGFSVEPIFSNQGEVG